MKHTLVGKVKGCILIVWFASILVFKSLSATDPVQITEWSGFLSSPGYPATYPANSSLTWITSVSPGNRVKITIFTLQTTCDTDYLEIKDGDSLASPLIARYCGDVGYTELTSSGTHVLLHFVSDGVIDEAQLGFQLQHIGDCQVHTNQTSGIITPPNYPNDYPNYMDCLWTIQLHPAMLITLECDEIAVEYEKDCTFDFMEILAGPSPDSPVLGRYCGVLNYSLTFEREGNMSIRFESDPDKEFRGFHCAYNVFKGLWTGSTSSSASPMSSTTIPSTVSSGTISSSHLGVTLSSSPASSTRSSSQFLVALSSSQNHSTVHSSLGSVTPSSSQPRVTLPSSQYRLTLSSSQLLVTPYPSKLSVSLSSSQFHGTPSTALRTLREIIESTVGRGATSSSSLEVFQILNSSSLFDRTISRTYYTNSATDSTLAERNIPTLMRGPSLSLFPTQSKSALHESMSLNSVVMEETFHASGQARHSLASTSSLTNGYSSYVISSTAVQLYRYAETSHTVPAVNVNSFQVTFGLSIDASASLQSLLSVTGDMPPFRTKLASLSISRSSTSKKSSLSNVSYDDLLVTDTRIGPLTINSLHQQTKQNTRYVTLHSFASILTPHSSLTGITSHAMNSTYSTSTASISNSHQSEPSSSDSWNYHIHSNSKSSSSNAYSSTSVDHRFTNTLASQSVSIWNRSRTATVGFSEKTTLISNKFSSLSRTSDHSTTSTLGSTLRGRHIMNVSPSNKIYSSPASYRRLSTQMTIDSSTESQQQHVTSIYRQSSHDLSKTVTYSLMTTAKATTYTATTRGRSTREFSQTDSLGTVKGTTLQMDSLGTVKKGTYVTSIDNRHGQNTVDPLSTLPMDFLGTVKGISIDNRHGQNTVDPLSTLQMDSLGAVKGTYKAYIDQTREQSTCSLPLSKSPQTDSLRTVKGTTDYGVSRVQGSFIAVEQSEKASNFQASSFQVQPSFSSLSPTISPSHTAPTHSTDDSVTPPAFRFPWHLTPFLVIIFVIIVVLFTYYLRVPDIVDALILAIKEKRRQMKASKPNNQSINMTKGNFSTEGFKTSPFHSYRREVFYEEELNYSFFEMEATKAIEFSVRLDDEENQSSGSEESVEISCEMEEEPLDKKHGHDTLSELFDTCGTDILSKRNTELNLPTTDTRRNGILYLHDSPASYEI